MQLNSICKWYVSIGIFIIFSIKFIVRPFIPLAEIGQLITDVTPNFVGTFIIPFAAFWWLKDFFRMATPFEVQQICFIGIVLVLINEYLQLIQIFGRTFDILDIIASVPGSYFGYTLFTYKLNKTLTTGQTAI